MKQNLQTAVIGALGGMLVMAIMAQAPMAIRSDGIQFTDETVQTTAALTKTFYLTEQGYPGSQAVDACDTGYHFASLWEILDVSNLRYRSYGAIFHPDSGEGPPTGANGWIRTGSIEWSGNDPGMANCNLWKSLSQDDFGSVVTLESDWSGTSAALAIAPWKAAAFACFNEFHVWCVSD